MTKRILDCIQRLEREMVGKTDAKPVPHEAGAFMHALILATRARHGLEIGTSYGYSGLWIAAALAENKGRLVTLDHDPRKTDAARATFESAGLSDIIETKVGAALDLLPALDGPFDFVLNDADKDNCIRYVDIIAGKLADRGVILTDNTLTHAPQLSGFLDWVRAQSGFYSTSVPIGNGMELTVKRTHR